MPTLPRELAMQRIASENICFRTIRGNLSLTENYQNNLDKVSYQGEDGEYYLIDLRSMSDPIQDGDKIFVIAPGKPLDEEGEVTCFLHQPSNKYYLVESAHKTLRRLEIAAIAKWQKFIWLLWMMIAAWGGISCFSSYSLTSTSWHASAIVLIGSSLLTSLSFFCYRNRWPIIFALSLPVATIVALLSLHLGFASQDSYHSTWENLPPWDTRHDQDIRELCAREIPLVGSTESFQNFVLLVSQYSGKYYFVWEKIASENYRHHWPTYWQNIFWSFMFFVFLMLTTLDYIQRYQASLQLKKQYKKIAEYFSEDS